MESLEYFFNKSNECDRQQCQKRDRTHFTVYDIGSTTQGIQ
jgi:hypothetical protein